MRKVFQARQFKRDLKRQKKRGKSIRELKEVVTLLAEGKDLEEKHRDHPLAGIWRGSRDCHFEPDWILIYTQDKENLVLERTGTHSDLFR